MQHDYISSFNQSDHCFLASSLSLPSSLLKLPNEADVSSREIFVREIDEGLTVFASKSKWVILLRLSYYSDVSQTIEPRITLFCWLAICPALRLIFDLLSSFFCQQIDVIAIIGGFDA